MHHPAHPAIKTNSPPPLSPNCGQKSVHTFLVTKNCSQEFVNENLFTKNRSQNGAKENHEAQHSIQQRFARLLSEATPAYRTGPGGGACAGGGKAGH